MGQEMSTHAVTVSRWEKGIRAMDVWQLTEAARLLKKPPSYFFKESDIEAHVAGREGTLRNHNGRFRKLMSNHPTLAELVAEMTITLDTFVTNHKPPKK